MSLYVYPYKQGSKSATLLAEALDVPKIRHRSSTFKGSRLKTVINWGSGELPREVRMSTVINQEGAVNAAVNKLSTFRLLQRAKVPTVEWTTDRTVASAWLRQGFRVVCRTTLEGKDGAGITIISPRSSFSLTPALPAALLYTKFERVKNEYRVNVCLGETMGVQVKVPRADATRVNPDVKTTDGGYGLRLTDSIPTGLRPVGRAAIAAVGLDFGGVDIIQVGNGVFKVLEINTAPELTPAMVNAFASQFRKKLT